MVELSPLKSAFSHYKQSYTKHFLKQGAFSLYHSKELDSLIKKAFALILKDFFEDFLPANIPLCIIATKQYSDFKLCANESVSLLFVYKDIKAFHLKPMIKAFNTALNDIGLITQTQICELSGLASKNELDIFGTRYICGSKALFKQAKEKFKLILSKDKDALAAELFSYFSLTQMPFIRQELNLNRGFGSLKDYANLDSLLTLFKNSAKNYALNFLSEKELSELRLAMDFLLSLKSAINIQSGKDSEQLMLLVLEDLSILMQKKDKKNLKAPQSLLVKAMQSAQIVGLYTHFLAKQIKLKNYGEDANLKPLNEFFSVLNLKSSLEPCAPLSHNYPPNLEQNESLNLAPNQSLNLTLNSNAPLFTHLSIALKALNALKEGLYSFDFSVIFALKRIKFSKKELEASFGEFKKIFYKKHSFCLFKVLNDSALLEILCKPFSESKFLMDEEHTYSHDENALLCLSELEKSWDEFEELKALNADEMAAIKLCVLLCGVQEENEVSLANIYRSYASKFDFSEEALELGIRLFKNFYAMSDLILKEDIYNETIVFTLISRLEKPQILRLLYVLTKIRARALKDDNDFFKRSLEKLLINANEGFLDESFLDESSRRTKKEQTLRRSKPFLEASAALQDKITHIKSNLFFIKNSFEDIVKIAKIADENSLKFWFNNDKNLIFEMTATTGLNLENILQATSHLNLIFMSFFPLFNDKIYLKFEYVDTISDAQKKSLEELLQKSLNHIEKRKLKKPSIKKDELKFDFEYSKTYVKLNLNTKDTRGLMAYLMRVFNEFKLVLSAAKIQTIRARTRNTFYFLKTPELMQNEQRLITTLTSE